MSLVVGPIGSCIVADFAFEGKWMRISFEKRIIDESLFDQSCTVEIGAAWKGFDVHSESKLYRVKFNTDGIDIMTVDTNTPIIVFKLPEVTMYSFKMQVLSMVEDSE